MTEGTQAIGRAVDVLRTVAQFPRAQATLARVARATGLSTPTAHRILRALVEQRLLVRDRTYRLGPLAWELGLAAPGAEARERWRSAVAEIARRTRLTSYLIARSGDEAVCLVCVPGAATIRAMPMEVGQRVPLGIGAGSLAILAALDDAEVRRIAALHADRLGAFPGGRREDGWMTGRVAETRRRGFAVSSETVAAGVGGIGLLAPDEGPGADLAFTVSAVSGAIGEEEAARLATTMRQIIREFG